MWGDYTMNIEKLMSLLLWIVVAVVIILFVAVIIIGYSTDFNFIFSLEDVSEVTNVITSKSSLLG